ncbi:MAG: tRNA (adenosine(37)-N6)-threonylcarbamoyltransferase complex dimerization subunit type 1 TsaB [Thermodesulfovibrio sp.]|nr:tRNA (adenosine(37)-N6)-threonylcarbamoyltransferase complex dimerization subunit type 1 TsaB [Thermodesulfovibrio sp.]
MLILGIDTSTKYAQIALVEDEKLLAEVTIKFKATHSEKLLPEISHLLDMLSIAVDNIDYYAVSIGPGSFTGLRVAVSTIKGLSFVTGKKVIPVSTVEALAWSLPYCKYQICPMIDARKGEVFSALFRWKEDEFIRITEDMVLDINDLIGLIKEKTLFVGDAAELYKPKLIEKLNNNAIISSSFWNTPKASSVAFLGLKKLRENQLVEARQLVPKYLRKSEAEIRFG